MISQKELQSEQKPVSPLPTGEPFLTPIENPPNLILKFIFSMIRRQFGVVFTNMKVHSARLPLAFAQFYGKVGSLDKKLLLPEETILLIRCQIAHINVCAFCMDANRWAVIQASMDEAKFDALEQYRTSELFTEAERAALDYVTELTVHKAVDPATFAQMARFYSERAICEIVWLVASEHLYNLTNIGLNIHSDMLCDPNKKNKHRR